MNRAEELIKKYAISLHMEAQNGERVPSGKLVTSRRQEVDHDGALSEISEHKAEIVKILMDEYNREKQEREERLRKISEIEGLKIIQDAKEDIESWQWEFDDSFRDVGGLGVRPRPNYDFDKLYAEYPRAHAYLKAEEYSRAYNYAKASAGRKALERIINGEDYEQVLKDMEDEWTEYCDEHIWD